MTRRVNSDLLLVGSLPAQTTDEALRQAAGFFGELVFSLPDGETGPRGGWVSYEREQLIRPNPAVVVLRDQSSPPDCLGTRTRPRCSASGRESPSCTGTAGRALTPPSRGTASSDRFAMRA